MGQGVNTKILQVAANVFSLPASRIKIQTTNTSRVANTSPSAASATADLNGKATQIACHEILNRLKKVAATELKVAIDMISIEHESVLVDGKSSGMSWNDVVMLTYNNRISLSEHAHYTPPTIHFDNTKEN